MMLALTILVAIWAVTMLLVVSLCRLAKRGDEAQAATTPRPNRHRVRPRGAHPVPGRVGTLRR